MQNLINSAAIKLLPTMSTALTPSEPLPKLRHRPVFSIFLLRSSNIAFDNLSDSLPARTLDPLAVPMLTRQTEHRGRGFLQLGQDCSFTYNSINSPDFSQPGFFWAPATLLAAPPVRCKLPVLPTLGKPLYHGETDFPQ